MFLQMFSDRILSQMQFTINGFLFTSNKALSFILQLITLDSLVFSEMPGPELVNSYMCVFFLPVNIMISCFVLML